MTTFNQAHAQIRADRINKFLQDQELVIEALGNDSECVQAAQDLAVTMSQVGTNLDKIATADFGYRMVRGVIHYIEGMLDEREIHLAAREMVDGLADAFRDEEWKSVA